MIQSQHKFLSKILKEKKLINPNYSLRAFSRDLRLSPSYLSELLSGKRCLSLKRAEEIAALLKFSEKRTLLFLSCKA